MSDVEGNLPSLKVAILLGQKMHCLKDVLYRFDIMKMGTIQLEEECEQD